LSAPPAPQQVEALLHAAPGLTLLAADVCCGADDAARMCRNDGVFRVLRLGKLLVEEGVRTAESLQALCAAAAEHASLDGLGVFDAPLVTPLTSLDALVSLALARSLAALVLVNCALSRAALPALTRLVAGGVRELHIFREEAQLEFWQVDDDEDDEDAWAASGLLSDAALLAPLCAALRASRALRSLTLSDLHLWRNADVVAALFGALSGHASLEALDVAHNNDAGPAHRARAAGAALGALLAADAPALRDVDARSCGLGNAGAAALLAGLASNTRLRSLSVSGNGLTEAAARNHLLPAVRGHAALRELDAGSDSRSSRLAEAIVVARSGV
jgi:hypothetical protein